MTTIAWDGAVLAADRKSSGDDFAAFRVTKIRQLAGGALIGASGQMAACYALIDWIAAGEEGDPPVPLSSDLWSDVILVEPDGRLFLWGEHGRYEVAPQPMAIGTGQAYALAAMACGKSAAEAVEVAALFDMRTGFGVDVLPLKRRSRRARG